MRGLKTPYFFAGAGKITYPICLNGQDIDWKNLVFIAY